MVPSTHLGKWMKHITVTHRVLTVYLNCNRDVYALVFVLWLVSLLKNQFDTSFQNEDWRLKYFCCEVLFKSVVLNLFFVQTLTAQTSLVVHPFDNTTPTMFKIVSYGWIIKWLSLYCTDDVRGKKRQLAAKSSSGGWVTARRAAEDREEGQRGWLVYQGN